MSMKRSLDYSIAAMIESQSHELSIKRTFTILKRWWKTLGSLAINTNIYIYTNRFFNHHQPVALTNQSTWVSIQTKKIKHFLNHSSSTCTPKRPNAIIFQFAKIHKNSGPHGFPFKKSPICWATFFWNFTNCCLMFGSIVWMKSMGAILRWASWKLGFHGIPWFPWFLIRVGFLGIRIRNSMVYEIIPKEIK